VPVPAITLRKGKESATSPGVLGSGGKKAGIPPIFHEKKSSGVSVIKGKGEKKKENDRFPPVGGWGRRKE